MEIREQSAELYVAFKGMTHNIILTGFINAAFTFLA